MRKNSRVVAGAALTIAIVAATVGIAHAATVDNGGFETGDFTGWTTEMQSGSAGDSFVYTGTSSPVSSNLIAAPPCGDWAVVTDMDGPGSYVVHQDIVLEAGMTHELSLQLYYEDRSDGGFVTPAPATLDYTAAPNQQYRVDIMDPSAGSFSVDPADVLETVFQTSPGDPASLAPTPMTADLSAYAGQTVRLRFAEVDNLGQLNASIDCVDIQSSVIPTTTTTSTTVAPTTTAAPTTTTAAAQPQALTPTFTG